MKFHSQSMSSLAATVTGASAAVRERSPAMVNASLEGVAKLVLKPLN